MDNSSPPPSIEFRGRLPEDPAPALLRAITLARHMERLALSGPSGGMFDPDLIEALAAAVAHDLEALAAPDASCSEGFCEAKRQ